MRNTIELFKLFSVYYIGFIFTLIVLYASPDNQCHLLQGSFFFLSSAIFVFFSLWNVSFVDESDRLIKITYILFAIVFISSGVLLVFITLYASPNDIPDIKGAWIFAVSSFIMVLGLFLMLKHDKKGVQNA